MELAQGYDRFRRLIYMQMLFTKMPWVTEYSTVHNNELIYYFAIQRASALFGRGAPRHHPGVESHPSPPIPPECGIT